MSPIVKSKPLITKRKPHWFNSPSTLDSLRPEQRAKREIEIHLQGIAKGKEEEKKERKQKLEKTLFDNVLKAKTIGETFFDFINEKGLACKTVYLMIEDIYNFRLLFLIDPSSYLSEGFSVVYEKAITERKLVNTDKFYVSILFMPEVENLDRNKIVRDGYDFYYNGKKEKSGPRDSQ
jgi:hypothetical protein